MPIDSPSPTIPFMPAALTWTAAWLVGVLVVAPVAVAAMGADLGDDLTIPQMTVVAVGGWAAFLLALALVTRFRGSGSWAADFGLRILPVDLIGIPLGVALQLAVVPALYAPLRGLWPDTFSSQQLEERAQDLADRASGGSTVLLVLLVVVGAPIVEELVYRGMLQRSLSSVLSRRAALVSIALWFALIHLSPVEYPGLFVAGLVFGGCVTLTDRIGPSILTHAAFNATGIFVVLSHR